MNIFRVSLPLQRTGLLLSMVLWSLLPSPSSSQDLQDLASQLDALKTAIPASQQRIASSIRAAAQMMTQQGIATTRTQMAQMLHISSRGEFDVYLHISMLTPEALGILRQHSVQVRQIDVPSGIVYATVARDALEDIAALHFVRWIGRPSYSVRRTGSVTSEGDTVMRANLVRANLGVTVQGYG